MLKNSVDDYQKSNYITYFLILLFLGLPVLGIVTSDLGQSSEDNILENIREPNYTADEPCAIGYYNPTGSNNSDDCIAASAGYYVEDDSEVKIIGLSAVPSIDK